MIKKSLVYLATLLIGYSVIVEFWKYEVLSDQHQWNKNKIKAEEFIYNSQPISDKQLVIGTSLSNRIVFDLLPNDVINLSFSGLSVYDGLAIVNKLKEKPSVIYLETNLVANRSSSPRFLKELFQPIPYYLKSYFQIFQEKNQPIGLLKNIIANIFYGFKKKPTSPKSADQIYIPKKRNKTNQKALLRYKKNKSIVPVDNLLNIRFSHLKNIVDSLRNQGTKIVFFEIPIASELCDLPAPVAIRNKMWEIFPTTSYEYIPKVNCGGYHTTDGHHLDRKSGVDFTLYLKEFMKK